MDELHTSLNKCCWQIHNLVPLEEQTQKDAKTSSLHEIMRIFPGSIPQIVYSRRHHGVPCLIVQGTWVRIHASVGLFPLGCVAPYAYIGPGGAFTETEAAPDL